MLQRGTSTKFHIVCSDESRNGTTLVARLLADYLILCKRAPLLFDAVPSPYGLRSYFPARALRINLSTTAGQMALFDRALEQPWRDCVVDLPAHLLSGVFDLMRHISFGEEAHTPGLGVVVLFVAGRSIDSLVAARKLRALFGPARFLIVRNEAILTPSLDRVAKSSYDCLASDGQVIVPKLDGTAMAAIEDRTFSIRRFLQETPKDMPHEICHPLEEFLSRVYRQFDQLNLGAEFKPPAARHMA
jgi:hypothetical protein